MGVSQFRTSGNVAFSDSMFSSVSIAPVTRMLFTLLESEAKHILK